MGGSYDQGLLAHEVAHTVQNARGETASLDGLGGDDATRNSLEDSADRVASSLVSARSISREGSAVQAQQDRNSEGPVQKPEREAESQAPATGRAIQRKAAPIQRRGQPIAGGGNDVRRVSPSTDSVINAIQTAAERRRGHGGFSDTPANIRNNGIAQQITRFLQNRQRVASGNFQSAWSDDNGENRVFDAWDYKMRVSFWIGYANERHMRDLGARDSTRGTQSTSGSGQSQQTTDGSSASVTGSAGVEAGEGGHQGAPSSGASAGGEGGVGTSHQTQDGSSSSESDQGTEGFGSREGYDRFQATMIVNFTVEFQPKGSTAGFLNNVHVHAQTFDGEVDAGTIYFDRVRL